MVQEQEMQDCSRKTDPITIWWPAVNVLNDMRTIRGMQVLSTAQKEDPLSPGLTITETEPKGDRLFMFMILFMATRIRIP